MRISVDRDKCCGFGTCMVAAPQLFDLRAEDNLAYPLVEEPGPELESALEQAITSCPTEAIIVTR